MAGSNAAALAAAAAAAAGEAGGGDGTPGGGGAGGAGRSGGGGGRRSTGPTGRAPSLRLANGRLGRSTGSGSAGSGSGLPAGLLAGGLGRGAAQSVEELWTAAPAGPAPTPRLHKEDSIKISIENTNTCTDSLVTAFDDEALLIDDCYLSNDNMNYKGSGKVSSLVQCVNLDITVYIPCISTECGPAA